MVSKYPSVFPWRNEQLHFRQNVYEANMTMIKQWFRNACLVVAFVSVATLLARPAIAQEGTFTLNLKNADIHSLIQTVSRQSGRNFVVDPRVKARVTVISSKPLNSDELYETFLSLLQVHG